MLWRFVVLACLCLLAGGTPAAASVKSRDMVFHNADAGGGCPRCRWIAAAGVITPDSPALLEALIGLGGFAREVRFDSTGGDLYAAMKIGRILRDHGLYADIGRTGRRQSGEAVRDEGECSGACLFAYLGGKVRYGGSASVIRIHGYYSDMDDYDAGRMVADPTEVPAQEMLATVLVDYVLRMGADARLVTLAAALGPGSPPRRLTREEMSALGVVNSDGRQAAWALEPRDGGVVATSGTARGTLTPRRLAIYCTAGDKSVILDVAADPPASLERLRQGLTGPELEITLMLDQVPYRVTRLDPATAMWADGAGRFHLSVRIPGSFGPRLLTARQIGIATNVAEIHNAGEDTIGFWGELASGRDMIATAFRNCLP